MLDNKVKTIRVRCNKCGTVQVFTVDEGHLMKSAVCPKCGEKVLELQTKTEVITK